jgi:thioredoxin-like negative regulator of GroEL
MLLAFEGDLSHQCMGRSAPQRLKRTLELASELFSDKFPNLERVYIDCEQLQEICAQHGVFSLPVVQVFF